MVLSTSWSCEEARRPWRGLCSTPSVATSRGFHSVVPAVVLQRLWSQASMFSELFLRPRAQLQLSTSICVPHLEGIRGAFDVPPLVPHIICEMSPQLGASYSSPRQFHLSGTRDVSKALSQLWLSNQVGSRVSIFSGMFRNLISPLVTKTNHSPVQLSACSFYAFGDSGVMASSREKQRATTLHNRRCRG